MVSLAPQRAGQAKNAEADEDQEASTHCDGIGEQFSAVAEATVVFTAVAVGGHLTPRPEPHGALAAAAEERSASGSAGRPATPARG